MSDTVEAVPCDLLIRAGSYLSLLWYRHTPAEIRGDFTLSLDVERTIAALRMAYESRGRNTHTCHGNKHMPPVPCDACKREELERLKESR